MLEELSLIEQYCDEFRSSAADGVDPGTPGSENYNNWLDAIGEQDDTITTEQEFRDAVRAAGYDPDDLLAD